MPRHSLKSKKLIQAIFKSGRRYHSKNLTLIHQRSIPELEKNYGVAFLMSSKSGNAVERNRIKRWLREDFRSLQLEKTIGGAFLIRFKGRIAEMKHPTLTNQLKQVYFSI